MSNQFEIDDFTALCDEEVVVGGNTCPAVINRTSSRYRDLNEVLKRNETLAEIFVLCENDIKLNDILTCGKTEFRVLEIRENITHQIKHLLCAAREKGSIIRGVET